MIELHRVIFYKDCLGNYWLRVKLASGKYEQLNDFCKLYHYELLGLTKYWFRHYGIFKRIQVLS